MNWIEVYCLACTLLWSAELTAGIYYRSEEVKFNLPFLIIFAYWPIVNIILLCMVYADIRAIRSSESNINDHCSAQANILGK